MSQSQLSTAASPARVARDAGRSRGMPRRGQLGPLRVVPAAIRRTGGGVFAVLCIVVLAAGLVALLMMNTALASGIYQLKDLQGQSGTLTDQQEQLTQAVDDLRSPRNLAAKAQQLGMVPAKSMAFIRLSDGSVIGAAQPAKDDQRLNVVTSPVAPPPPPPAPAPDPAATTPAPAATTSAPAPNPATAPTPNPTP
jgi:hypothetical protein